MVINQICNIVFAEFSEILSNRISPREDKAKATELDEYYVLYYTEYNRNYYMNMFKICIILSMGIFVFVLNESLKN